MRVQHKYEPTVFGADVRAFLCTFFQEDRSQRPEFEAGFGALRRRELIQLAEAHKLEINPDLAKDAMLPQFEMWWREGKFRVTARPSLSAEDWDRMKAEIKAEMAAPQELDAETLLAAPNFEERVRALGWNQLRGFANNIGIKTPPGTKADDLVETILRRHRAA